MIVDLFNWIRVRRTVACFEDISSFCPGSKQSKEWSFGHVLLLRSAHLKSHQLFPLKCKGIVVFCVMIWPCNEISCIIEQIILNCSDVQNGHRRY